MGAAEGLAGGRVQEVTLLPTGTSQSNDAIGNSDPVSDAGGGEDSEPFSPLPAVILSPRFPEGTTEN
jgi:hypothetical protein